MLLFIHSPRYVFISNVDSKKFYDEARINVLLSTRLQLYKLVVLKRARVKLLYVKVDTSNSEPASYVQINSSRSKVIMKFSFLAEIIANDGKIPESTIFQKKKKKEKPVNVKRMLTHNPTP